LEADKRIEELEKKVAALEVRVQEQPDIERIAEVVAKRLVLPDYDSKQLCKTTPVILDSSDEIKVLDLRDLAKSFLSKKKTLIEKEVTTLETDKRIEELEKKPSEKGKDIYVTLNVEGSDVLKEISAGSELKIETTCTGKRNVTVKLSKYCRIK